jgi:hypothetical protein
MYLPSPLTMPCAFPLGLSTDRFRSFPFPRPFREAVSLAISITTCIHFFDKDDMYTCVQVAKTKERAGRRFAVRVILSGQAAPSISG